LITSLSTGLSKNYSSTGRNDLDKSLQQTLDRICTKLGQSTDEQHMKELTFIIFESIQTDLLLSKIHELGLVKSLDSNKLVASFKYL
jgi:hypothetical protein